MVWDLIAYQKDMRRLRWAISAAVGLADARGSLADFAVLCWLRRPHRRRRGLTRSESERRSSRRSAGRGERRGASSAEFGARPDQRGGGSVAWKTRPNSILPMLLLRAAHRVLALRVRRGQNGWRRSRRWLWEGLLLWSQLSDIRVVAATRNRPLLWNWCGHYMYMQHNHNVSRLKRLLTFSAASRCWSVST